MSDIIRVFRDFTKDALFYLETKDTRFSTHPYGPMYDDAVGRLFEVCPGAAFPGDAESIVGYVKAIMPELPEGWSYPIEVIAQAVNQEGNLVLFAKICHRKNSTKEIRDRNKADGKIVTIELYGDSAKIYVVKKDD